MPPNSTAGRPAVRERLHWVALMTNVGSGGPWLPGAVNLHPYVSFVNPLQELKGSDSVDRRGKVGHWVRQLPSS